MSKKELLDKGRQLDVCIRVGKNGLSDEIVKEITAQLKRKKLIKVKFLPNSLENKDKKEEARKLAEMTNSELVYAVGFVAVLYKK